MSEQKTEVRAQRTDITDKITHTELSDETVERVLKEVFKVGKRPPQVALFRTENGRDAFLAAARKLRGGHY